MILGHRGFFRAWLGIFVLGAVMLLAGCAATVPPAAGRAEFEKGLKYSEWLYRQPIDLLRNEPFHLPMPKAKVSTASPAQREAVQPDTATKAYAVQLGSFRIEANARRFLREAQASHPRWKFELRHSAGLWRVVVGFYGTHDDARVVRDILRRQGFPDAWIFHFE